MSGVTLVRRIAARPTIVFDLMTTAEGVASWWGPQDLPVVRAEVDARVGGAYRVHFRTLDGGEHEACGEFLEVVPPRRIVMSYRYTLGGEPGEEGRTSRIEVDLTPIADGTEVTLKHVDLRSEVSERSHTWGWSGALDKLVRHAATVDAEGRKT